MIDRHDPDTKEKDGDEKTDPPQTGGTGLDGPYDVFGYLVVIFLTIYQRGPNL
jgi:hypothetical protein